MSNEPQSGCFLRVFIGIVLPPLVGAMVISLWHIPFLENLAAFIQEYSMNVLAALLVGAIGFVVYSLLMEFCVWPLIGTGCPAVLASAVLGIACGACVCPVSFRLTGDFRPTATFMVAGLVAGLVTWAVLRHMRRAASRSVRGTPSSL